MAIPSYKDIVELLKKVATTEAQETIMALRETAIELQEQNLQLREENNQLRERLSARENMQWDPPYYWRVNDGEQEGPYCQHCFDTEDKTIRLQTSGNGYWECYACKNGYKDKTYKDSGPIFTRSQSDIDWSAY